MSTFSELVKDLDPEALRLRTALEVYAARGKASDRVKAASHALDEARALEQQVRTLRDGHLAELQRRLDVLAESDDRGRAELVVEKAKANAEYRPAANALSKAEDNLANAERALKAALAEEAQHPILSPH